MNIDYTDIVIFEYDLSNRCINIITWVTFSNKGTVVKVEKSYCIIWIYLIPRSEPINSPTKILTRFSESVISLEKDKAVMHPRFII